MQMCVLASGSGGNCSVLMIGAAPTARVCLLDAGLSPRRTRRQLGELGLRFDQVDHVLVTHFDSDHFHLGWQNAALGRTRIHAHADHSRLARAAGVPAENLMLFDDGFELWEETVVTHARLAHDDAGVTAFRVETESSSLGFATDLGRATPELTRALHGVGTLAIESNYCREMQIRSTRPASLKKRIMGGAGHLSNDESAEASREIAPAAEVVLLHLSRQCNRPARALAAHEPNGSPVVIADQFEPTRWIDVASKRARALPPPEPVQPGLFGPTERDL